LKEELKKYEPYLKLYQDLKEEHDKLVEEKKK
jgi:hypothetical protein